MRIKMMCDRPYKLWHGYFCCHTTTPWWVWKIIKQVFWEVFEEKKNLRGWLVFFHCHATRLEQLDDESLAKKPDRPTHKCYKCLFPSSTWTCIDFKLDIDMANTNNEILFRVVIKISDKIELCSEVSLRVVLDVNFPVQTLISMWTYITGQPFDCCEIV